MKLTKNDFKIETLFEDMQQTNEHLGLILGTPGGGFLTKHELLKIFMLTNDKVFVLDNDRESEPLVNFLNENFIKERTNEIVTFSSNTDTNCIYEQILDTAKTETCWFVSRETDILKNDEDFLDFYEKAKNLNIFFILSACDLEGLLTNENFCKIANEGKHFLILKTSRYDDEILNKILEIKQNVLGKINNLDLCFGFAKINNETVTFDTIKEYNTTSDKTYGMIVCPSSYPMNK